MLRRLLPAIVAALLAAPAAEAGAASYRTCAGGDAANGIFRVQVRGTSCATGVAVAKRTNSVKCFLNGDRCTHRFRGRRWTCRLQEGAAGPAVHCRSARRNVRYRLG
jgi:hypothetical protein